MKFENSKDSNMRTVFSVIEAKEVSGGNLFRDFLQLRMTSEKNFEQVPESCVEPIFYGIWVSDIDLGITCQKILKKSSSTWSHTHYREQKVV